MPKLKKSFKLTFAAIAREFGLTRATVAQKAKNIEHDGSLSSWRKLLNYYFNKYDK